jgi:hypothetical protein
MGHEKTTLTTPLFSFFLSFYNLFCMYTFLTVRKIGYVLSCYEKIMNCVRDDIYGGKGHDRFSIRF